MTVKKQIESKPNTLGLNKASDGHDTHNHDRLHSRLSRTSRNEIDSSTQNIESKSRYNLTIDPAFFVISIISILTRCHKLAHPNSIVFDELHYIKFITLYLKKIFFFDPQPPFGKQLLTAAAYITNFKGDLDYSQIGEEYKLDVPIQLLRLFPSICGSLIAPMGYLVSLAMNLSQTSAILVSSLFILENAFVTQSKFLLIEPILILLSITSLYCYLKFHKSLSTCWLLMSTITATLALCTKYSGFYCYTLLLGLVFTTWWRSIDKLKTTSLISKTIGFVACTTLFPLMIYIGIYYAHLSWLTKAGPHDNIMTSAFQASLENGLASITRGQPLEIVHGSQVTLRHTHGRSCWLHSHEHLYPIKYADGRGSSHQQQVTCYSFKDVNNWWIVKRPDIDELIVREPQQRIKDGDLVQLVHGLTGRSLNSHDVASAMSPYSQEVSCYVDHNISMPAQDLWRIKLQNPSDTNNYWHTLNSRFQLIHYNSSLALKFSGRQLADWGFHQHEIVADKDLKNDDTIWNVEEHRYSKSEDQKEREMQLGQAEFLPLEPISLSFFEKFYELHLKLLTYHQDMLKDHIYASESPLDWIFMNRGTAYWVDNKPTSNAQIFLIGNPDISKLGIISIVVFGSFILFYSIRRQRQIYHDLTDNHWDNLSFQAIVLVSGYLIHVLPYFLYESPLFLQSYLNAMVFKILIIGACFNHIRYLVNNSWITISTSALIIGQVMRTFITLAPLTYGLDITQTELEKLKWKETWQLIS